MSGSSQSAVSTIDPNQSSVWAANAGWVTARPDSQSGMVVSDTVCSGYWYGANFGWVHLGNGLPANGIRYQNNSSQDYGVNIDEQGRLRGFAYGANIGWINFEETGAPKVNYQTGQISGYAYSPNIGWIALSGQSFSLRTQSIDPGVDTDNDGLPDAWEIQMAGNLTTLSGNQDTDHDGMSDLEEYLAGTDPLNPKDNLRAELALTSDKAQLRWSANVLRQYHVERKDTLDPSAPWVPVTDLLTPSSNGVMQVEFPLPGSGSQSFFRVIAERLLSH